MCSLHVQAQKDTLTALLGALMTGPKPSQFPGMDQGVAAADATSRDYSNASSQWKMTRTQLPLRLGSILAQVPDPVQVRGQRGAH